MQISTSILNASDRVESVLKLNRTNTSYIHIDVMDGKFVDNEQFTINEIKAINLVSKYPMDVHLMVADPIKYINELDSMSIEWITFHLEIEKDIQKIINKIKKMGYKVGISIKPDTSVNELIPYLSEIDMVLIMSVEPGLGGQKFISATYKKIKELRKIITDKNLSIKIEVDGGINEENIFKLVDVDIAVVGSYIVKSDNYYNRIEKLLNSKMDKQENRFYNKKDINMLKLKIFLQFCFGIIPFILVLSSSLWIAKNGFTIDGAGPGSGWEGFIWTIEALFGFLIIGLILIVLGIKNFSKLKGSSKSRGPNIK